MALKKKNMALITKYFLPGKYTPESACEHPGAVRQLALEFARAGGDVTQTFTYGSTEGMLTMMMMTMMMMMGQQKVQNIIYVHENNMKSAPSPNYSFIHHQTLKHCLIEVFRNVGGMPVHPRADQPGSVRNC